MTTTTKIPALLAPQFKTGGKPTDIVFTPSKPGVPDDATSPVLLKAAPQLLPAVMKNPRRLVIIECPYGTEDPSMRDKYALYAKKCLQDSLKRGEAPFAGQLFYAKLLNDRVQAEKDVGLISHLSWIPVADLIAVYIDMGLSSSMQIAINVAMIKNKRIEYRSIGKVS
jgi:hypothetical protein